MGSDVYDYVLTETAEADIDETLSYIAGDLSNPEAAADFLDEFEKQIEEICISPKNGRLVNNEYSKRDDVRRFLIKNYVAYYIADEENSKIVVLRVVYGGRNQDKIIKDL